jgi:hypothetical protein
MKVPDIIQQALDECPLPWEIIPGKKHQQVFISGKLVGVFPLNAKKGSQGGKGGLNVRAAIKRAIREAGI